MMELTETPVQQTTYSLISSLEYVENYEVVQYGIEQLYVNESGETVKTKIDNISEEKEIVLKLIEKIENKDVHPSVLMDIVVDYITEFYTF